jgi:hypothetical protein
VSLPRLVLLLALALFLLSVAGTLVALGVFFWYDTDFWEVFEPRGVLRLAAVLLFGLVISSGVLFVHYKGQESYMTFEALVFLVSFAISLVNLLWILPVLFFI